MFGSPPTMPASPAASACGTKTSGRRSARLPPPARCTDRQSIMATAHDPGRLPTGLPVPQDDGAARHLTGTKLPSMALAATNGSQTDLSAFDGRTVVYIFPLTIRLCNEHPDRLDTIPGPRTPSPPLYSQP